MSCSLQHKILNVEAFAKDDLRKAYEKCNDISQESRALIDSFLKEGSDKDYELNLSMYGNAAKLEKLKDAKLAWLLDKYYYRSQESVEQAMDAKAREEKIRQKQADDDEFFLTFGRALTMCSSTRVACTGCLGHIDNFLEKEKLAQVVAIVKTCSLNALGDLNVTMKDLSGTVHGTVHYKVLDVGTYGKDIHVGAAMILAKVSVFTLRPSKHYLNITRENVVKVFRKDTVSLA
ncbi:GPCR kinase [Tanacetum coccineum]